MMLAVGQHVCSLAGQILRSAESIGIGAGEDQNGPIGIGVVEAMPEEDFDHLVSRAMTAAAREPEPVENAG